MIYGALPRDLGLVDLSPTEMMFWMYCPVSVPGGALTLPDNLDQYRPLLMRAWEDEPTRFRGEYVYLTAKTVWSSPGNVGSRPGWHSDGFGTNDLNYIWYDRAPTEFFKGQFTLPSGCDDAMAIMAEHAAGAPLVTYSAKHLLKLTSAVIHRSPEAFEAGPRTFVKVSISPDRYNLLGNSINHGLNEHWPLVPRQAERNHPVAP